MRTCLQFSRRVWVMRNLGRRRLASRHKERKTETVILVNRCEGVDSVQYVASAQHLVKVRPLSLLPVRAAAWRRRSIQNHLETVSMLGNVGHLRSSLRTYALVRGFEVSCDSGWRGTNGP